MKTGIYRIHNTVTGDKYVGSAVDIPKRWKLHRWQLRKGKHHSRFLQRAWNKYGAAAFVFTVVGYCTPEERLRFEQRAIDTGAHAYNLAKDAQSPMRGRHHTPEARAKIGAVHRGVPSAMKGKHHTAATRARMSVGQRARAPASAATRAKLSAAHLGRPCTAEARARQSATRRARRIGVGTHPTKAARDNMGRAKAVFSAGQVRGIRAAVMAGWSQRDVAQLLGIPPVTVGQIHNRTTYKWVTP